MQALAARLSGLPAAPLRSPSGGSPGAHVTHFARAIVRACSWTVSHCQVLAAAASLAQLFKASPSTLDGVLSAMAAPSPPSSAAGSVASTSSGAGGSSGASTPSSTTGKRPRSPTLQWEDNVFELPLKRAKTLHFMDLTDGDHASMARPPFDPKA